MCVTSADAFIGKELQEFNGVVGNGYYDTFRFKGISLSRIRGCVSSSMEIFREEKTFLSIHICLLGSVEYHAEQLSAPYHVSALEIKIISGEFIGIKSKLPANEETSEISIFLDENTYKELLQRTAQSIVDHTPLDENLSVFDMDAAYNSLLYFINLPHPKNQMERVAIQGYCYAIIGEVLNRITKNTASPPPAKRSAAEQVKSIIDSNIKSNKTIRQLANISGTNECYLKREFKALTGSSIADYRQKQRIRYALLLLRRGTVTIDALATQVGYQNTDHFIRIFRRHIGIHPREYNIQRATIKPANKPQQ